MKTNVNLKKVSTREKKRRTNKRSTLLRHDYRTQLVVRFHDHIKLPYSSDVSKYIKDFQVGDWEQLIKKYPGIAISPLFTSIKPEKLMKLVAKAKEMDSSYKDGNFFQYFKIICPVEINPQSIIEDLAKWKNIKSSSILKKYSQPAVSYTDEIYANLPEDPYQKYLDAAPDGISAKTVWDSSLVGDDGAGINFIDIETGWTLDHVDLNLPLTNLLWGSNDDANRAHGTSVIGIVGAKDNGIGCIGIAPNSNMNVISHFGDTVANAILKSLEYLSFGDVLLIEATTSAEYSGTPCDVPIEINNLEYEAIRLATALGIIVIEPGGNGDGVTSCVNFTDFEVGGKVILKPSTVADPNPDFKDSGAIIVTAAQSSLCSQAGYETTHAKMPWAPFGDRIDCYAWGEGIKTLSSDSLGATGTYTDEPNLFGGTSGAAAIIAGVVLQMQSLAVANQGYRFSPGQIRKILRNSINGTQLSNHITGSIYETLEIYMPDLQKFTSQSLNLLPDIYLRDFIGDEGLPHAGFISWSPDVINRTSEVTDPQAEYGELNVTNRNRDDLSENATKDQINYLYFRILNQGGAEPTNAKVHAFYSVPSTLITPSLMNYIGETDFPYPIPIGEILTVSNKLEWTPTSATGHYCFVAVVNSDEDPGPDPRNIPDWDWDKYCRYIRENNNVTWKNFDIVEMKKSSTSPVPDEEPENVQAPDPDPIQEEDPINNNEPTPGQNGLPKKGWLRLDFFSPGLPDRDQRMSLEVISKLPKDVKVLLQIPIVWKKTVFKGSPYVLHNKKRKVGFAPIKPLGESKLENIQFRANSKTPLNLFLHIPEKFKNRNYTIAVRQMLEGTEVGRFTWKLVPPKKDVIKPIKKPVKRTK
ncbi:MAG: hypothetical protein A2W99_09465 [Bacteroidetes bacterium GWF2_33_16]|nr:MAG: hypothetical protein A2X00_06375 [Bacteroidetes bacterium GWE2_32_14]OFY07225.1 MAG: hypothetical protein A2W99_09465 [Bacteroidetes bacterium GWF2_33_16]